MKLGLAYELKKDYQSAVAVYDKVLTKYDDASEKVNAKKYKAKLEAMIATGKQEPAPQKSEEKESDKK